MRSDDYVGTTDAGEPDDVKLLLVPEGGAGVARLLRVAGVGVGGHGADLALLLLTPG